jgi:predicted amidohydrolase
MTHGGATTAFSPRDASGTARADLVVTSASRFPAGGFLSVSTDDSMRHSAAIRIAWAPLAGDTLKPAIVIARIDARDARQVLAAAHVTADTTSDATEIRWTLPGAAKPSGGARIDAKSGEVTPLPPRATVRVAAVQCPSDLGATAKNLDRITALVDDAARGGAKFVVLPETAVQGYLSQDLKTVWHVPGMPRAAAFTAGLDPKDAAEPADGASVRRLGALAARWGLWLTVPFLEVVETPGAGRTPTRTYFNSAVLAGPDGAVAAHYRKLTPWPHPEQSWATPGDRGIATAETPYGRVGLAICFDVHEVFPRYAALQKKPWAMLYPVAWVSTGDDAQWFGRELPRRAEEHGFHVVAANWSTDIPQTWDGAGFSTVISRTGVVLAKAVARTGSEIVFADLPVAE